MYLRLYDRDNQQRLTGEEALRSFLSDAVDEVFRHIANQQIHKVFEIIESTKQSDVGRKISRFYRVFDSSILGDQDYSIFFQGTGRRSDELEERFNHYRVTKPLFVLARLKRRLTVCGVPHESLPVNGGGVHW